MPIDLSGMLPFLADIPVWDQYVSFLEHSLDFLAKTFNSAGMAVIVFTIVIKTVLLPLTVKSIRSSKAMQDLQPKIKELQKKYGKDRQRLSQETMRLYSQYQVNPMAGCLPMLVQIPIFFGLYRAIANLSEGKGPADASALWAQSFMWLDNLATADPYKILPILAGAFQFVQTKMMRPAGQGKITDPQQAMMNTMMNFMPLMVVIFGWNFASGPVIYWVTQSVYSVVQQWFITGWGSLKDWVPGLWDLPEHRRLGYRPPRDLDDVVVVSGEGAVQRSGFMGWMQRRVEEAQAQQAERQAAMKAAKPGSSSTPSASTSSVDGETPTAPAPRAPRPVKKGSTSAKAAAAREGGTGGADAAAGATSNGHASFNGTKPRVTPKKARPARPPREET